MALQNKQRPWRSHKCKSKNLTLPDAALQSRSMTTICSDSAPNILAPLLEQVEDLVQRLRTQRRCLLTLRRSEEPYWQRVSGRLCQALELQECALTATQFVVQDVAIVTAAGKVVAALTPTLTALNLEHLVVPHADPFLAHAFYFGQGHNGCVCDLLQGACSFLRNWKGPQAVIVHCLRDLSIYLDALSSTSWPCAVSYTVKASSLLAKSFDETLAESALTMFGRGFRPAFNDDLSSSVLEMPGGDFEDRIVTLFWIRT